MRSLAWTIGWSGVAGAVEWAIAACAGVGCARVLVVGFDRWRAVRGMRIEALACKVGYEPNGLKEPATMSLKSECRVAPILKR